MDVLVPLGDADGEVAERVRGDVDAAGSKRSRCCAANAR